MCVCVCGGGGGGGRIPGVQSAADTREDTVIYIVSQYSYAARFLPKIADSAIACLTFLA